MPCPECGASVEQTQSHAHVCDRDRLVDFQMFALRDEIARFEALVREHLGSAKGSFEVWQAARDVRAT